MHPLMLFGPIDRIAEHELFAGKSVLAFVLFVLVVINIVTRLLAYRSHVKQVRDSGEDTEIARYTPHVISTVLVILGSFYYVTFDVHPGMVLSVLVLGMFVADFFEIEHRRVRVRGEGTLKPPNSAIAVSLLVFLYVSFHSVFFIVKPIWTAIV